MSDSSFNTIDFFQFDNLIKNRVPFLFYNLSESVAEWFDVVNKIHLKNVEQFIPVEEIIPDIESKNLPNFFPVVILCPDGRISRDLVQQLENKGFTNVFYLKDGRNNQSPIKD